MSTSADSNPPQPIASTSGLADWTFRAQLMTALCGLVFLTGALITWLAYRSAQASTAELADSLFREVSAHAVAHSRSFVEQALPLAKSLEQLAGEGLALDDSDRLARQLLAVLKAHEGMSWVSYGDAEGRFTGAYRTPEGTLRINQSQIVDGKTRLVEHDVLSDGSWREHRRDADSGFDPRKRSWYQKAAANRKPVWLPPYVFFNQAIPGISCATAVRDAGDQVRGVFSVDFDLNALSQFIGGLRVSEHSVVFLFTADEVLLAHPQQRVVATEGQGGEGKLLKLADVADPLVAAFREQLRPEWLQVAEAKGDSGRDASHLFELSHQNENYFASATTFRLGDDLVWVVGAMAPKSDFLPGFWASQGGALAASLAAMAVAMLLAAVLAQHVSQPIEELIGFMQRVGGGDLEAKADLGGNREFRALSQALNRMIEELREGDRLRHSLNVAMDVQQRLLPSKPPSVPGLDIAGHSTYCDETGGDYYDFVSLEEAAPGQLLVALGDVMGHGVAAALVMAGVRAVLRDRATHASLAELMGRLNRMMATDLDGSRFMTMHLSVIDTRSGSMRWVSAGHDPAMLYDPARGEIEEIDAANLPLGIMDDTEYAEATYAPLRPGQVIVIGTDGVWEMPNSATDQFGKDRLREIIRATSTRPAAEIMQAILDRLKEFRGECRPADDVTFVVIKINDEAR